jgi:hypothetical protein
MDARLDAQVVKRDVDLCMFRSDNRQTDSPRDFWAKSSLANLHDEAQLNLVVVVVVNDLDGHLNLVVPRMMAKYAQKVLLQPMTTEQSS